MAIVYTKYSNDRAVGYRIRTDIEKSKDGIMSVYKRPMGEEDFKHILETYDNYLALKECFKSTKLTPNVTEKINNGLKFEFIKGKTLEEKLDQLLENLDIEGFKKLLKEYVDIIYSRATNDYYVTEDYEKLFGEFELDEKYKSLPISDVDMIFANIFVDNDKWIVIDYEWTFSFPIPVKYIVFRTIYYYISFGRNEILSKYIDMYEYVGITQEEKVFFEKCEINFQRNILKGNKSLWNINDEMSGRLLFPYQYIEEKIESDNNRKGKIELIDSEGVIDKIEFFPFEKKDGELEYGFEIDSTKVDKIKIYLYRKACQLESEGFVLLGDYGVVYAKTQHNGQKSGEDGFSFFEEPCIEITEIPENTKSVLLKYRICDYTKEKLMEKVLYEENTKDKLTEYERIINSKNEQIYRLSSEVETSKQDLVEVFNSKSWKITKPFRKLMKTIRR